MNDPAAPPAPSKEGGRPRHRAGRPKSASTGEPLEATLELTEDRLLLLDGDGKTKYDWRRVRP